MREEVTNLPERIEAAMAERVRWARDTLAVYAEDTVAAGCAQQVLHAAEMDRRELAWLRGRLADNAPAWATECITARYGVAP